MRKRIADVLRRSTPDVVSAVFERALAHHTTTLAAGLAFFGLLSFAPAVGMALGSLYLVVGAGEVDQLVNALQSSFSDVLGFSQMLEQMQGRATSYAGFGLLLFLWPATTLASGWTRALDAIEEIEHLRPARGVIGRIKGVVLGALLLLGILILISAMILGQRLLAVDAVAVVAVIAAGVVFQTAFCLAMYRVLASRPRTWRELWPGAMLAAVLIVAATAMFAMLLSAVGNLAERYPPSLSTALVLGLWLYAINLGLLFGAEFNAVRAQRHSTADAQAGST